MLPFSIFFIVVCCIAIGCTIHDTVVAVKNDRFSIKSLIGSIIIDIVLISITILSFVFYDFFD